MNNTGTKAGISYLEDSKAIRNGHIDVIVNTMPYKEA